MQKMGKCYKVLVLSLFVLYCLPGYAVPGSAGTDGQSQKSSVDARRPGGATQTENAAIKADRVLKVTIEDLADETVVTVAGNGTFEGYDFQQSGEREFALILGDILKEAPHPPLPFPSKTLKLLYGDGKSSKSLQLVGRLSSPLDHHTVDATGNQLVLRLYPAKQMTSENVALQRAMEPQAIGGPPPKKRKSPEPAFSGLPTVPEPHHVATKVLGAEITASATNAKKSYIGKPISLDLLDTDLKNVLRLLADISGTNMVIEPDVSGTVTLKVEQVPWDQVLDLVLSMNNLGREQRGNVIRIASQGKLKQEMAAQEEEIKARQKLLEVVQDSGVIATEYLTINYAQPATIAARINEIRSEKGKISVDERTSLIIYSDFPSRIASVRELVRRLDKPEPQVMIEARIVQLSSTASRSLGIDWSFDFVHLGGKDQSAIDFQVNHPVPGDVFGFVFGQITGQTMWNIDLRLSALEEAGQGKIISAPRVLTLNHVKAMIQQGTEVPYLELSGLNVATTAFKEAVLELQVTPHITPDNKVRLQIQAKKEQPDFSRAAAVQGQPPIDTRKVETELLVADGNTVVIGGIIETDETLNKSGTPGLNRVPILGSLFKSERMRAEKRELLIFICPKIVEPSMLGQKASM